MTQADLRQQAIAVRARAYAPYSGFLVGAAVRTPSGRIYAGCNVENAAYPEGTCAEAGAIAAMIAGGDTEIAEAYVVVDTEMPASPCGGCRQKLSEFAGREVVIHLGTMAGAETQTTVGALLPGAFDAAQMEKDADI